MTGILPSHISLAEVNRKVGHVGLKQSYTEILTTRSIQPKSTPGNLPKVDKDVERALYTA